MTPTDPLCPNCQGEGEIQFNPSKHIPPDPQMDDYAVCPECQGTGLMGSDGC